MRTCYGCTDNFQIDVGLHQASALSQFLFITALHTISEDFSQESFIELLFADDLVIMAGTEVELKKKWIT